MNVRFELPRGYSTGLAKRNESDTLISIDLDSQLGIDPNKQLTLGGSVTIGPSVDDLELDDQRTAFRVCRTMIGGRTARIATFPLHPLERSTLPSPGHEHVLSSYWDMPGINNLGIAFLVNSPEGVRDGLAIIHSVTFVDAKR